MHDMGIITCMLVQGAAAVERTYHLMRLCPLLFRQEEAHA